MSRCIHTYPIVKQFVTCSIINDSQLSNGLQDDDAEVFQTSDLVASLHAIIWDRVKIPFMLLSIVSKVAMGNKVVFW